MRPPAVALMWHRVCPRGPDTACYFARGTAVEPETLHRQLDWIARHHRVMAPSAWLTAAGRAPVVLLTFDDGYRDLAEYVAPACAARGLPFAAFPVAEPTDGGPPCWVDAYYAVLHRARRRAGWRRVPLAPPDGAPPLDADLRWWVRGPIKAALHRLDPPARRAALAALADALDAPPDAIGESSDAIGEGLYCTRADLAALRAAGHDLGGHGRRHLRLSDCEPATRRAEITASAALLDALAVPRPRLFCYPDGAHDAASVAAVRAAGFDAAFTVEPGAIDPATDALRLPRHIVRDRPPTAAGWCAAFQESSP